MEEKSRDLFEEGSRDEDRDLIRDEVRYTVARFADEAGKKERVKVPAVVVDIVTELAHQYAERLTLDMCSFAKHARRTTISPEDVRLCVRHNSSAEGLLDNFARDVLGEPAQACGERGGKPRKRLIDDSHDEEEDDAPDCLGGR